MTEYLFKLKKDGKTVGYCEWTEDWGWKYFNDLNPENKFTHFMVAQTGFTAHPFVTKKNDKDIFAGDRIRRVDGEPCVVEWFAEECRYILRNNQNCYDIDPLEYEQFELIEEEQ